MGWTYTHRPAWQSVKDFLKKRQNCDNETARWEVLDIAIVRFRTAYAAIRITSKQTGKSYVFGAVILLNFCKDHYNTGYKDMDESMGPYQCECPERILNLLTPLEAAEYPGSEYGNANAQVWRDACWANIRARQSRIKLKVGMRLLYPDGFRFKNGEVLREFVVIEPRSSVFSHADGCGRYRLTRSIIERCSVVTSEEVNHVDAA